MKMIQNLTLKLMANGPAYDRAVMVRFPAAALTTNGYAVASIDYEAGFPAQIHDAKAAGTLAARQCWQLSAGSKMQDRESSACGRGGVRRSEGSEAQRWSRSAPVGSIVKEGNRFAMTIMLKLPPDLEARLLAAAEEQHLPVEEVVKAFLYNFRPLPGRKGTLAEEIDRGFEEAADLIPEGVPPLSDEAISRDSIYIREDDWNR